MPLPMQGPLYQSWASSLNLCFRLVRRDGVDNAAFVLKCLDECIILAGRFLPKFRLNFSKFPEGGLILVILVLGLLLTIFGG